MDLGIFAQQSNNAISFVQPLGCTSNHFHGLLFLKRLVLMVC
ncbi:hypothetical protein XNC1_0013 [Xenorhabdus nematophila ATCC 19061]|uniref:Uncharacterized protein n=1 Tax=Xenorhabdus nematophila (strain ATCC 19061 / DSM 3370 / CCUG 14189 / LMG 1036 / NCIMB 9965 / AN6) TaxID=406817 RepID=D3VG16_XENNA|nr:hypothetical protein XNC1_0013 [Xenorhabdus nematophila ATCC 19061]